MSRLTLDTPGAGNLAVINIAWYHGLELDRFISRQAFIHHTIVLVSCTAQQGNLSAMRPIIPPPCHGQVIGVMVLELVLHPSSISCWTCGVNDQAEHWRACTEIWRTSLRSGIHIHTVRCTWVARPSLVWPSQVRERLGFLCPEPDKPPRPGQVCSHAVISDCHLPSGWRPAGAH